MAIGNQPTVGGINDRAGHLTVRWHELAEDMLDFATGPASTLSVADLQALGFTFADATAMAAAIVSMGTFAGVYFGTGAQTVAFNYDTAFLPLRGVTT